MYANDAEERKDLRQEILAQGWKSFANFRGDARFSTWLYKVGMNVAISSLRNKKQYTEVADKHFANRVSGNEQELLQQILQMLNPIEKSLVLLMIEGYEQPEMADILGISANNVRVKVHRIREKLKKYEIEQFVG
jgi:RNA polymerase sigma-70 factor (ECF subfamily)